VKIMIGWKTLLHSQVPDAGAQPLLSLDEVKLRVVATLADCDSAIANRLRMQARSCHAAGDLWLLRGDIYQVIARRHCQLEAGRRLNELLPAFRGWLPDQKLTRL
jgi:hypothetical protein